MDQLTLLSEELPARASASQENAKEWTELLDSSANIFDFLRKFVRAGLYGKMSPEPSHLDETREMISDLSFSGGMTSGLASHGVYLTLNISEWPSDAAVCLLSDILETGEIPSRYFLSQKACQGILRQAEKRGKKLPALLEKCLRQASDTPPPVSPAVTCGPPFSRTGNERTEADALVCGKNHWEGGPHPTLSQASKFSGGPGFSNQEIFGGGAGLCSEAIRERERERGFRLVAFGEYADDNTASTLKMRDYKDATDLICTNDAKS